MLNDYLKDCVQTADELRAILGLTEEQAAEIDDCAAFPMLATRYYLGLIDPSDPDDPIRRMCVPSEGEKSEVGRLFTGGEDDNTVTRGMQHKYAQTALILSTSRCSTYCRFCFRRRFVGAHDMEVAQELNKLKEYILAHPDINNALISGGDSFVNENDVIRAYLDLLAPLEQLKFIRFGTRTPVVCPRRVYDDTELLGLLCEYGRSKQIYIVTHFNHPRELTPEAKRAIDALRDTGADIKNQTVLLRGVNDDPSTLASLFTGLTAWGVTPYYLFQCRPVKGVQSTFAVPIAVGSDIVRAARRRLNGPSKQFRYALSHKTGKIEVLGRYESGADEKLLFRYHQAKNPDDDGRIFGIPSAEVGEWL